jgi:hypothetical protein
MTPDEEARDDRRSVRDTILQVIAATATPIVGMLATSTGDPRSDQLVLTWVVLAAFSIAAIVSLSFLKSRRAQKYVTQNQHAEVLGRLDKQHEMMQLMLTAQQHTMRQELISSAERYLRRGWLTAEEHRAWSEMYGAYEQLGLNGYMGSYMRRIDGLPLRKLEDVVNE